MAVTRETSWFGEGPMAESFKNFRRIRRRNLQHVRKAERHWQNWSRRRARAQIVIEQRLWFQNLPDSESSDGRPTSEHDPDDFDDGALLDRHDQRNQVFQISFISLNTTVVSNAKPLLAESLVGALTKLVGSNRLSRFVVAWFMSLITAATFPSSQLWFFLFIRWREETIHVPRTRRITQVRRQGQSRWAKEFSRCLQCDMISTHR